MTGWVRGGEQRTAADRRRSSGRSGPLKVAALTAVFAAVAVSIQPLLWNSYVFLVGLSDLPLVVTAATFWWWTQQAVVLPHLVAAALLCLATPLLVRLALHGTRPRLRQLVSAALAGLGLGAVLTHLYFDSVGGSETPGDVAGLFAVYAIVSLPWMWMAQLIAEPRALSTTLGPR